MSASEARICANQSNATRSTGPRTDEGKAISRGNALKHGLAGEGIVLPNEDAAEVARRSATMQAEMKPSGELGRALVHRIALLSVRLDRSVAQETAALSDRVRQAEADFVAPEGLDARTIAQLRGEAGARAMFDPSKEATLARKYEAAAERGFFRALKEFRQVEKEAKAIGASPEIGAARQALGSFMPAEDLVKMMKSLPTRAPAATPSRPIPTVAPASKVSVGRPFDVPFTIGRAR